MAIETARFIVTLVIDNGDDDLDCESLAEILQTAIERHDLAYGLIHGARSQIKRITVSEEEL